VAYLSNETGRAEVYVMPFTPPGSSAGSAGGKWQVSKDGVESQPPQWRADGRELYFRAANGTPMAVRVHAGSAFQAGIPERLLQFPGSVGPWTVAADGRGVLAARTQALHAPEPITVVLNWASGLRRP
jgi:hypothetical protein